MGEMEISLASSKRLQKLKGKWNGSAAQIYMAAKDVQQQKMTKWEGKWNGIRPESELAAKDDEQQKLTSCQQ